jgi:hypothetical protein
MDREEILLILETGKKAKAKEIQELIRKNVAIMDSDVQFEFKLKLKQLTDIKRCIEQISSLSPNKDNKDQ